MGSLGVRACDVNHSVERGIKEIFKITAVSKSIKMFKSSSGPLRASAKKPRLSHLLDRSRTLVVHVQFHSVIVCFFSQKWGINRVARPSA